jgi:hypothetical protein
MASIRITSIPPEEAPLAIRQAWAGLVLPLRRKRPGRYLAAGILSGASLCRGCRVVRRS